MKNWIISLMLVFFILKFVICADNSKQTDDEQSFLNNERVMVDNISLLQSGESDKNQQAYSYQEKTDAYQDDHSGLPERDCAYQDDHSGLPERDCAHKEEQCGLPEIDSVHQEEQCDLPERDCAHKEEQYGLPERDSVHQERQCDLPERDCAHKEEQYGLPERDSVHQERQCDLPERDCAHKEEQYGLPERDCAHQEEQCDHQEIDNAHHERHFVFPEIERAHQERHFIFPEIDSVHQERQCGLPEIDNAHKERHFIFPEIERAHKERHFIFPEIERAHKERQCDFPERDSVHHERQCGLPEIIRAHQKEQCDHQEIDNAHHERHFVFPEIERAHQEGHFVFPDIERAHKERHFVFPEIERAHKERHFIFPEIERAHNERHFVFPEIERAHNERQCDFPERDSVHQEKLFLTPVRPSVIVLAPSYQSIRAQEPFSRKSVITFGHTLKRQSIESDDDRPAKIIKPDDSEQPSTSQTVQSVACAPTAIMKKVDKRKQKNPMKYTCTVNQTLMHNDDSPLGSKKISLTLKRTSKKAHCEIILSSTDSEKDLQVDLETDSEKNLEIDLEKDSITESEKNSVTESEKDLQIESEMDLETDSAKESTPDAGQDESKSDDNTTAQNKSFTVMNIIENLKDLQETSRLNSFKFSNLKNNIFCDILNCIDTTRIVCSKMKLEIVGKKTMTMVEFDANCDMIGSTPLTMNNITIFGGRLKSYENLLCSFYVPLKVFEYEQIKNKSLIEGNKYYQLIDNYLIVSMFFLKPRFKKPSKVINLSKENKPINNTEIYFSIPVNHQNPFNCLKNNFLAFHDGQPLLFIYAETIYRYHRFIVRILNDTNCGKLSDSTVMPFWGSYVIKDLSRRRRKKT